MRVAIAGGHGKVAMLLGEFLVDAGDEVVGLIRNREQWTELAVKGIEAEVCDLEGDDDVAAAIRRSDAVVFAAGAGGGSSAERKVSMDLGGAVRLIEAAKAEGIARYLMISSLGAADHPAEGDSIYDVYQRAKADADKALIASGLDYTIIRPGDLTDDPGTRLVSIAERLPDSPVPRSDVAAVLAACLRSPNTIGKAVDLTAGTIPLAAAVAAI
jgi:uncharacterized protein YbjT (DUF2867 family)